MNKFYTVFLLLIIFCVTGFAQISVSPLLLHLNEKKNTGHFTVYNNTQDTLECLLNNNFGYPVSDDSGNVYVKMIDTVSIDEPSASDWIRMYPKNFFLYPLSSQVVRVLAKPQDKVKEGEYWSRPSITAKKKYSTVTETGSPGKLNTAFNMEIKMFLVMNYRSGKVYTNIDASILNFHCDGKNLIFLISLERMGNAAFLGKIKTALIENDESFYENAVDVAVYHKLKKRIEIPLDKINRKSFKAEILISSDREDDGADILKINPVILRKDITLE